MQAIKSILSCATLIAFAMPLQAQVKVFGHLQGEIASINDGTTSATQVKDNKRGRLGVVYSDKMEGGMEGIAKFE